MEAAERRSRYNEESQRVISSKRTTRRTSSSDSRICRICWFVSAHVGTMMTTSTNREQARSWIETTRRTSKEHQHREERRDTMTDDRKENKHTQSHWHHTHLSALSIFFHRAIRKGRLFSERIQLCLVDMIDRQSRGVSAAHNLVIIPTALIHISPYTLSFDSSAMALRVGIGTLQEADGGAHANHPVPVEQGRVGLQAREELELRADGCGPVVLEQATRVAALSWMDARHRINGHMLWGWTVTPPPFTPTPTFGLMPQ